MSKRTGWPAVALAVLALSGCQSNLDGESGNAGGARPVADALAKTVAPDAGPLAVDWSSLGDCRAQLAALVRRVGAEPREQPQEAPFAVVVASRAGPQSWLEPAASYVRSDLPLPVYQGRGRSMPGEPCVIEIGPARQLDAQRHAVRRETVRSAYQSGTRSEKNPAYDVAQARLRQVEREMKDSSSGVMEVGDPLLDLVGLLVGGVLSGFASHGERDALDEALTDLASTPRELDRPIWRAYHFERTLVRAGKSALIPVVLVDRARGLEWEVELRQSEYRDFEILDGLDPRDRDYERHDAASISRHELDRWLERPPELELSAAAKALLDPSSAGVTVAGDEDARLRSKVAAGGNDADAIGDEPLDASLSRLKGAPAGARAAALRPSRYQAGAKRRRPSTALPARRGAAETAYGAQRAESVVLIEADGRTGLGFYVGPRQVLTVRRLVEGATLLDVTTADGETVPALTAATDGWGDIALVQVPKRGAPVRLRPDGWRPGPGTRLEVASRAAGRAELVRAEVAAADALAGEDEIVIEVDGAAELAGSPLLAGDEVMAMMTGRTASTDDLGVALAAGALARFLARVAPALVARGEASPTPASGLSRQAEPGQ